MRRDPRRPAIQGSRARGLAALLILALAGAASLPGALAQTLEAVRIDAPGPLKDPEAAYWSQTPAVTVTMQPQIVTEPRNPDAAVSELIVRAVHNGEWLAVLIEWEDPTSNDRFRIDTFGDQVAVQFPIEGTPNPMMGNPGGTVNILQWRAAFQRDLLEGEPGIRDLYPNVLVDVYPDEVLRLTDARAYTGALGVDNPVTRPFDSPVLDQAAEGWGSLTVKPVQLADGRGHWQDGRWRVAITRPSASILPGDPDLSPGTETRAGFAVWDGGNREVGARKAWSPWIDLVIEE